MFLGILRPYFIVFIRSHKIRISSKIKSEYASVKDLPDPQPAAQSQEEGVAAPKQDDNADLSTVDQVLEQMNGERGNKRQKTSTGLVEYKPGVLVTKDGPVRSCGSNTVNVFLICVMFAQSTTGSRALALRRKPPKVRFFHPSILENKRLDSLLRRSQLQSGMPLGI